MHGLGNDFVVLDARSLPLSIGPAEARAICDRRHGVGCDQLITLEPPRNGRAEAFMRIHNPDGGEAEACGNAARCVARLLMEEMAVDRIALETVAGVLEARAAGEARVTVDMGPVRLDWREIPLAGACDTAHLPLARGPLEDPVGVNIGNPHAVFLVDDVEAIDIETLGPLLENDPLFPERANIEVVQVLDPRRLRMRVWERGAGLTCACGSGACAAVVAAHRRGLGERRATVVLDGGELEIEWRADGRVLMTGPATVSFRGRIEDSLLARE